MGVLSEVNFAEETADEAATETSARASRFAVVAAAVLAVALLFSLSWLAATVGVERWQERRANVLVEAAIEGDHARMRTLIDRGADPNARGRDGVTPLEAAVRENRTETALVLLESGADPTDEAARIAMGHGHVEVLMTLIENGGDPDVRDDWLHTSALEWAVDRSNRSLVRFLLDWGADPDDTDALTRPALHRAAANDDREMVRLLLDHGASPSLRWHRQTPATAAELAGHEQMKRMLRELEGS